MRNPLIIVSLILAISATSVKAQDNALYFNGDNATDDYVSHGQIIAPQSSYTKEAYIRIMKASDTIGYRNILSSSDDIFMIRSGRLEAGNHQIYDYISYDLHLTSFPTDFIHVAVTFDATVTPALMRLYVNGVRVKDQFPTQAQQNFGILPSGGQVDMGAHAYNNASNFVGQIDELRVWNVARTDAQIASDWYHPVVDPAAEPNLIAYFKFDQGKAGGDNRSLNQLKDEKNNFNGVFKNFALTGNSSNFVKGRTYYLPDPFLSFTLQKFNGVVGLNWSTAFEQHSKSFELQRSIDLGSNWTTINTQTAAGNSTTTKNYSYNDNYIPITPTWYRVALKDSFTQVFFSDTLTAFPDSQATEPFIVGVDPSRNAIHIFNQKVSDPAITVTLHDMMGRMIYQTKLNITMGGNAALNFPGITKGIYIVRIGYTGGYDTKRVIIN